MFLFFYVGVKIGIAIGIEVGMTWGINSPGKVAKLLAQKWVSQFAWIAFATWSWGGHVQTQKWCRHHCHYQYHSHHHHHHYHHHQHRRKNWKLKLPKETMVWKVRIQKIITCAESADIIQDVIHDLLLNGLACRMDSNPSRMGSNCSRMDSKARRID